MGWLPTAGSWIDAGSGLLLLALGLAVALVKPRRRANVLFALFAGAYGLLFLMANLVGRDDPLFVRLNNASAPLGIVAAVALAGLVATSPRPADRDEVRRALLPALALTVLVLGLYSAFLPAGVLSSEPTLAVSGQRIVRFSMAGAIAAFALRFRTARSDGERRQYVLMSAALSMHPMLIGGIFLASAPPLGASLVHLAMPAVLAALWLWAAASDAVWSRAARAAALVPPAAALVGIGLGALVPAANDSGAVGLARTFSVVILAYAIVRHQLLGIDVKLRFAIRQSTVAAVFIGVFFIVSEGAQQFLGETLGSTYVGIVAAGALVFAIAPLQRAAERLANRAVPGAPAADLARRLAVYRDALALAWRDGSLDREEARHLADLRDTLGLPREAAERVEHEWTHGGQEAR